MTQSPSHANTVRAAHVGSKLLLVPNIWDAGSARRVAAAGANVIATTSAGMAWAHGYSDGEKMPVEYLLSSVERIVASVELPVTVDIESGHSDSPEEVAALVARLARLGATGVNIEDGDGSPGLLVKKLMAMRLALGPEDMFINVRTDVYLRGLVEPQERVEETIRRGVLYESAGADGLFVPGLMVPDQIRAVAEAVELPLNIMALPGLPSLEELTSLGVRRLSAGPWLAQDAFTTVQESTTQFLGTGSIEHLGARARSFSELDATGAP